MIKLSTNIFAEYESSTSREWLETNGIGGYAFSTVSGANTRRYHGLLIAATRPPLGRMVLLSKLEETLIIDGRRYELSTNQYPGVVHPEGFRYLTSFRLDPFPVWTYEVNGVEIEKSVFMIYGENSTVCRWKIKNRSEISNLKSEIELKPLLAFRDHHLLRHAAARFCSDYQEGKGSVSITPYPEMPTLHFAHNAIRVEHQGHWYRDLEYTIERGRGFDYGEDLYQPFSLTFDLSSDAVVIASTTERTAADASRLEAAEGERRSGLIEKAGFKDKLLSSLVLAADQFIVNRGEGKTVIAGYPWFSDWGRDTMIALNGLTLAANRPEIAKSVLIEFSKHISEGMLPNRFPDAGETPEYNTVDATLWFFEAIRAYCAKTEDYGLIRDGLYDRLVEIIEWHVRGTRYKIHVDTDGLLYAGEPGQQLTWMDAKVGDWVVTPRTGKPVEIQALWYNALCVMEDLARRVADERGERRYREMAEIARENFNGQFWNESFQCLYDVVNGADRDASVRPNQIFAVSLPYTMLDSEKASLVVKKVEAELLTPVGLRSLSPNDPAYEPIYIGSPLTRDGAYHQGTVWGWLIGPFVDAYRKTHSNDTRSNQRINEIIAGFSAHLGDVTVGQISEIFDAEPPHTPRGAPAQAWSVAELLRIAVTQEK